MRAERIPIALFAFVALVAIVPAWMHFVGQTTDMPTEVSWLFAFSLPAVALLFIGSWLGGDF